MLPEWQQALADLKRNGNADIAIILRDYIESISTDDRLSFVIAERNYLAGRIARISQRTEMAILAESYEHVHKERAALAELDA